MQLKQVQSRSWLLVTAGMIWRQRARRLTSILLVTLVASFLLAIAAGGIFERREQVRAELLEPLREIMTGKPFLIPQRMAKGLWAKPERIVIDIKHVNYMKLAYQREVAMAKGYLVQGANDYVPATIRYGDQSTKVKLRLKGDWTDHLIGDKWSFRVRVRGDNTLFGMKQFSIHHPRTRNYINEWLFHEALKREGVLSLRYNFITVTLNGKDLGVYAVEEHFEKRLIEHGQLKEGPIIRFSEDLLWKERIRQHDQFPSAVWNPVGLFLSSDIDAFKTNAIRANPVSYAQYEKAIYLLESLRRDQLTTSEVFDVQKLARYFAIADLMGAKHSVFWNNFRFYYNPITSRLEPIGFDGDSGKPIKAISAALDGVYIGHDSPNVREFRVLLFKDPLFFEEYIKALERVSEPSYLDTFLAELDEELEQKLAIIYSDFPQFYFSEKILYKNQEYIRTVLNPVKGLHAHYGGATENQLELELGNIHSVPIEVLGVSYQGATRFEAAKKIVLPAKLLSDPIDYQIGRFLLPADFRWSETMIQDLKVDYRLLGASRIRQETVFPWSYLGDHSVDGDFIRQQPNVDAFDFLITNRATQEILIKPGVWRLHQSLIIPKGYRVIAGPGTRLDLSNSAKILSYSPLEFTGNEESPIIIQSSDSTGQGLIVMNVAQRSILNYVIFDNLANPSQSGWELTGAVTFYESPVEIFRCRFIGNRSEDALNVVRSEFTIDETFFNQTSSDAFDADFASGSITSSSFVAIGNDAVDVSGSVVELHDISIHKAGDKGLSAGENSQMTVSQLEINESEIAVASKDMSEIAIRGAAISGGQIGFAAYQKKPEFGGASIEVRGLDMSQVNIPYLIEADSKMIVNDVAVKSNRDDVKGILYGVEYGKSSN